MKKKDPLYVFIHVSKCAGTSILNNILANFNEDEVIQLYSNVYPFLNKIRDIENHFKLMDRSKKEKVKVIYGHVVYYGIHDFFPDRDVRYILFLRDPISRTISQYNYDRTRYYLLDEASRKKIFPKGENDFSFDCWYDNRNNPKRYWNSKSFKNYIFKFLSMQCIDRNIFENSVEDSINEVLKIMGKMYFVGIAENKEDIFYIYKLMGLRKFVGNKNISKNFLDEKQVIKAKDLTKDVVSYDYRIYDYAKVLSDRFKKKDPSFFRGLEILGLKYYFYGLKEKYIQEGLVFYVKKFYHYYVKEFYYSVRRFYLNICGFLRDFLREIRIMPFRISSFLKRRSLRYRRFVAWFKFKTGIR
ncbi:hypothetical protein CMI42_02485 [Candidatus Pacearchaeota archaeon]|nr:hypothetical protein [Candidatus Pacearchaeota archaeon]|tara:strand:- start:792 stop:1862 length:1071 start_codon:yes stop_codon:yes gene_type:complete